MISREEALYLLETWISSESLRKHCLSVAAAMEAYAQKYQLPQKGIDIYWITGLLHDFDYEKYPSLEQHPYEGVKVLKEKNYPKEIIHAILGHGNHTGVKRESLMAKTLFAVDELCGLATALSRVRPDGFATMTPASIEKAFKKKDFAKAISREDIEQGIQELGVNREEHFSLVIQALARLHG